MKRSFIKPATLTVKKYTQSESYGKITRVLSSTLSVDGSRPQPAKGEILRNHPELQKASEVLRVYCDDIEVITVSDVVEWNGSDYKIFEAALHDESDISHYRLIIYRD